MNRLDPPTAPLASDGRILALCEAHLAREERLVETMRASLREVRDAFLRRDLKNLPSLRDRQQELLAAEPEIARERDMLRAALAPLLGIAPAEVTLSGAALALMEPARGRLLRRHARLVEMVRESEQLHRHNASLLGYARGFLDCLFAGFARASGSEGYGPQGERRGVSYGPFLQARV